VAKRPSSDIITWPCLSKTGSDSVDIVKRDHVDLQEKQGGQAGEYYHLTEDEWRNWTGATNRSGVYTPSVLSTTIPGLLVRQSQYLQVGHVVTVSTSFACTGSGEAVLSLPLDPKADLVSRQLGGAGAHSQGVRTEGFGRGAKVIVSGVSGYRLITLAFTYLMH